jgi:hypothetical protein
MAGTAGSFWKRHSRWVVIGLVAAWVGVISLNRAGVFGGGAATTKGATELLQIGALPVT